MSEILDPTESDWDFARLLMNGATCEVFKMKGRDSLIPDGETFEGKLDAPEGKEKHIRPGEMVFFSNEQRRFAIGAVESIETLDAITKIIVRTRNGSSYAVEQVDPEKYHRKMSLMYLRRCYLGFEDYMYDEFYDGGKSLKFCIDAGLRFRTCSREVVVYNSEEDDALAEQTDFADRLVTPVEDMKTKAVLLAQYVSETLGGSTSSTIIDDTEECITRIAVSNPYGLKRVFIGRLTHGVCRHRAGKFKYFADRLGIKSHLVRGDMDLGYHVGAHAWNTVRIDNSDGSYTYYLVDVMNNPGELIETSKPDVEMYKRKGTVKGFEGGYGGESVVAHIASQFERFEKIIKDDDK
jgi:hypothetical protein